VRFLVEVERSSRRIFTLRATIKQLITRYSLILLCEKLVLCKLRTPSPTQTTNAAVFHFIEVNQIMLQWEIEDDSSPSCRFAVRQEPREVIVPIVTHGILLIRSILQSHHQLIHRVFGFIYLNLEIVDCIPVDSSIWARWFWQFSQARFTLTSKGNGQHQLTNMEIVCPHVSMPLNGISEKRPPRESIEIRALDFTYPRS